MRFNKIARYGLIVAVLGICIVFIQIRKVDEPQEEKAVAVVAEQVKTPAKVVEEPKKEIAVSTVSTPSVEPSLKPVSTDQKVPFSSQAPLGGWSDERQQDGCEEASALMAMLWVTNTTVSKEDALKRILAISDFEQKKYGEYRDVSVHDVVARIFKDYFKYDKVAVKENATIADIVSALKKGSIVIVPANGQLLHNPYFTAPGPERHMLLIRGYNADTKQFITNDPGTKRGEGYRYDEDVLYNAILAYSTGYHIPVEGTPKHVIIVSK